MFFKNLLEKFVHKYLGKSLKQSRMKTWWKNRMNPKWNSGKISWRNSLGVAEETVPAEIQTQQKKTLTYIARKKPEKLVIEKS